MAHHGVQGILGDTQPVRLQVEMQSVDTEVSGWISQTLSRQPAKGRYLGNSVPLDDVPENYLVHIALQQFYPPFPGQPLSFRKPADGQIRTEFFLDSRPVSRGEFPGASRRLHSPVPQKLPS